jgi:thioredoxin reductase
MDSRESIDIAVVGAGPYGISLGLTLKSLGSKFIVFGQPMDSWVNHMPKGMHLKSQGFASNIFDPAGSSLESFCLERGLPFEREGLPIPLDTFCKYGIESHARLGPLADTRYVTDVSKSKSSFEIRLADGATVRAGKVVLSIGIAHFAYMPEEFADLPRDLVSHSADHSDPSAFEGRKVLVVGAGASGIGLAALMASSGCEATLVTSYSEVAFDLPPRPGGRKLLQRMRRPNSCFGPGIKGYLFEHAPLVFRSFPEGTRFKVVKDFVGPCGGWYSEESYRSQVRSILDSRITSVRTQRGKAQVSFTSSSGSVSDELFDHVIFATGYRPDVARLGFLEATLRREIRSVRGAPVLSASFESSVPGLHFSGLASAPTFGPSMRFVCGTKFTSKRLAKHL